MVGRAAQGCLVGVLALLLGCGTRESGGAATTRSPILTTSNCVTVERQTGRTVADTFVDEGARRTNFGSQPILLVSPADETLLWFELGQIPQGARVDRATLELTSLGGTGRGTIEVHLATTPWSEKTVTFGSFGQSYSPAVSATFTGGTSQSPSVDLTAVVADWASGAQPNHGLVLTAEPHRWLGRFGRGASQGTTALFLSSEAPRRGGGPALEVCYTLSDYCSPNPCLNGGTCNDGVNDYTCDCAPGFTGTDCQINVDDCTPNPCLNGGECIDGPNSYACNCAPGFSGTNCETNTDDCTPNPCLNGGTCIDGIASYTCNCLPGYGGPTCGEATSCAPPPPGFPGVYRGTASVSTYWTMPLGYDTPPSCNEYSARTVTQAVLDISGPPYAVSLSLADPAPNALTLNTTSVPPGIPVPVWEIAPSGLSLTNWYPCYLNMYWDSQQPAIIYLDPATNTVTFRVHCATGFMDSCLFSTNQETDWDMTLSLSCVKGQTVYLNGNAVTCDASGNITSSVPCATPPGACAPPAPDACTTGGAPICTNFQTDPKNCGQCGNACTAQQACQQGSCVTVCASGVTACGDPTLGVSCQNLSSAWYGCGACDRFCLPLTACSGGVCGGCVAPTPDRCSTAFGQPTFCTDTQTDPSNCGTCYHVCPQGQTCQGGACSP